MKRFPLILSIFIMLFIVSCKNENSPKNNNQSKTEKRIVSLNGALSEILADLDYGNQIVGRDVTSTYPEFIRDSVKDLGHVRSLSIEAILALQPNLIMATDDELSDDLEKSIRDSGIEFKLFSQEFSIEGTKELISEVADYVGETEKQKSIFEDIDKSLKKLETFENQPKVLFVYARGAGTLMVAGEDTQMQKMVNLAGGKNAIPGITGFKPLTEEAILENNPDVILMFDSGLESVGGKKGFIKSIPAISQTSAGENKAIITMEGGLLADFGPRVGKAVYQLNQLLKPYAN